MPYTKTTFVNGAAPAISAAELNKIGDGLATAQATAEAAAPADHTHTAAQVGAAPASHTHGAADLSGVVKTVNGTGPDGAGNVVVAGGGGTAEPQNWVAGRWGLPGGGLGGGISSESTSTGTIYGAVFRPSASATLTGISCSVATEATTAGATARLGIYSVADPAGGGASLVHDAGTVAIDSTGVKTITGLSVSLGPGWYLAVVTVGDACTLHARQVIRDIAGQSNLGSAWPSNGRPMATHIGADAPAGTLPPSPSFTPRGGWTVGFARALVVFA